MTTKNYAIVRGGKPLSGKVKPIPNKNSILAVLPACILTDETVTYKDVPDTTDVKMVLEVLRYLGADVDDSDYSEIKITCKNIKTSKLDLEAATRMRASLLFAGPLIARTGWAEIPVPGGCKLGQRSIAAHLDNFRKSGIGISFSDDFVKFEQVKKPEEQKLRKIWQTEASVTATENLAMYAAGTPEDVLIIDAACEPHVVDLLNLLVSMGAKIEGIGSNQVRISGTQNLKGTIYTPRADFIDVAGFIVAAAITDGEIQIEGAGDFSVSGGLIQWFEKFNIDLSVKGADLIVKRKGDIKIDLQSSGFPMAKNNLPKLCPRPWPGYPVDALPVVVSLALKLQGDLYINNWIYEHGLEFVDQLNQLGANIEVLDAQQIIVHGPVVLKGGEVETPEVIQSCKAIFLAALADPVETKIYGVDILKRRYPNIFETYKSLGADIAVYED